MPNSFLDWVREIEDDDQVTTLQIERQPDPYIRIFAICLFVLIVFVAGVQVGKWDDRERANTVYGETK